MLALDTAVSKIVAEKKNLQLACYAVTINNIKISLTSLYIKQKKVGFRYIVENNPFVSLASARAYASNSRPPSRFVWPAEGLKTFSEVHAAELTCGLVLVRRPEFGDP